MYKSKQKETLNSVVFMWISFAFAILAILMMFVPCLSINAVPHSAQEIFFQGPIGDEAGIWPSFIGYMLIAVGALFTGITGLPFFQPNKGKEMLFILGSAACFVAGIILVMLMKVEYCSLNDKMATINSYHLLAGPYLTLAFAAISTICNVFVAKLDW